LDLRRIRYVVYDVSSRNRNPLSSPGDNKSSGSPVSPLPPVRVICGRYRALGLR